MGQLAMELQAMVQLATELATGLGAMVTLVMESLHLQATAHQQAMATPIVRDQSTTVHF